MTLWQWIVGLLPKKSKHPADFDDGNFDPLERQRLREKVALEATRAAEARLSMHQGGNF